MSRRTLAAGMVVLGLALPAAGQAFYLVGNAPGTDGSRVYAVSGDGTVAGGQSTSTSGSSYPGFLWTLGGGRRDLGPDEGFSPASSVTGLSHDGATAVGTFRTTAEATRAFRYRGPGTLENLGGLPNHLSTLATAVSGDGSVVIGNAEAGPVPGQAGQPFRWTQSGGMQGLGHALPGHHYGQALGVTPTGSMIVGWSWGGAGVGAAFAWTEANGMQVLPNLPGSTSGSTAHAVNQDGTVIAGASGPESTAVIWRNGQVEAIPLPPGGFIRAYPSDMNAVGDAWVGQFQMTTNPDLAAMWTQSRGLETLSDYLAFRGIGVPAGWTLVNASSISDNGSVIAGWALPPQGQAVGFVAVIPGPASWTLALTLGWCGRRDRRTCAVI